MAKIDRYLSFRECRMLAKHGLDYFVWKGIPCIRTWPRPSRYPRSPTQLAWQAQFKVLSETYKALPLYAKQLLQRQGSKRGMTGRNLYFKLQLQEWLLAHPEFR